MPATATLFSTLRQSLGLARRVGVAVLESRVRSLEGTDTVRDEVPEQLLDVIGSGGMPLDMSVQRALEERMDADFSNVRIHTGAKAAEAADAIDAKSFTCGNTTSSSTPASSIVRVGSRPVLARVGRYR